MPLKLPKIMSNKNLKDSMLHEKKDAMEMEVLSEPNNWATKLVTTISDFGIQVREKAAVVFERNLGRSSSEQRNVDEASHCTLNLLDPHEALQRSYGSCSPNPNLNSPHAYQNGVGSGNQYRERKMSIRTRRRSSSTGGQISPYNSPYFEQNPGMCSDFNPSAPPTINKFNIPVINIEQDENFLTVDTSFKPGYGFGHFGALSSGFNSAPASPLPSPGLGGSTFDFGTFDPENKFTIGRYIKIGVLIFLFVGIAGIITATSENEIHFTQISASSDKPFAFPLRVLKPLTPWYPLLTILVKGAFVPKKYANFTTKRLLVDVELKDDYNNGDKIVTERWELPIFGESSIGTIPESTESHSFSLENLNWNNGSYSLVFRTNSEDNFPLSVSVKLVSQVVENGAIFGGAVIIGLYILIIFELVNRTLSAMLAATAAIGILAFFDERPTTEEMVSWLDMETLILLFSMMVLVSILCETGFFDYCAYVMYKLTNGEVWPMITSLCMFTAFVSAFLDNVTTILLMTPVTIRICEAMELNPVPILISIVIFSNIGGACTPVGDPPNVIISNNPEVIAEGINFASFTTHMLLGIIPVILVAYLQLRITFRSMKSLQFSEPYVVAELRREIEVWTRAADSLSSYSKDENHVKALLLSKVVDLRNKLKSKIKMGGQSVESYKANLMELKESCQIRDWPLLIKCGIVLSTVIMLFFLHSIPQLNLSMGWTALLGAVLLLILADPRDLEGILSRVEWSTLIFFSALFIVMEGVSRLGLLEYIGGQTEAVILNVHPDSRLTVAVMLILWVSGIASAFIDNIPFTTMMVKIVTRVASNLSLPMQPLIWALAFGTCLGGNGTLIGASANVVCAGLADQHGYRFSFMAYFKIGFPMMIVSLIVASGYLLVCHTLFSWNS